MWGQIAYDWKTMPISRRSGATKRPAAGSLTTRSPMTMRPASFCSRPAIMRSVVVLPQPDGPSSVSSRPSATSRETASTAHTVPNRLLTPSTLTPGIAAPIAPASRSELSVPAGAGGEATRALLALAGVVRRLAERELVAERLPGRAPIAAHAARRKFGDAPRERLGLLARPARRHDAVGEAEGERFARVHRPSGQDHIERARQTDKPWQPHGAAVDERDAPPATEDAEHRRPSRHPQVAHQRQLETAGDRVALDGGDRRLRE